MSKRNLQNNFSVPPKYIDTKRSLRIEDAPPQPAPAKKPAAEKPPPGQTLKQRFEDFSTKRKVNPPVETFVHPPPATKPFIRKEPPAPVPTIDIVVPDSPQDNFTQFFGLEPAEKKEPPRALIDQAIADIRQVEVMCDKDMLASRLLAKRLKEVEDKVDKVNVLMQELLKEREALKMAIEIQEAAVAFNKKELQDIKETLNIQ
jgi:hypothetical protein